MSRENLSIVLSVDQAPERVFDAITNVRGWWGAGVEGSSSAVGDVFVYRHEDIHESTQEVLELVPAEKVVWRVTDARLSFVAKQREWKGTEVRFEIARKGGQSELRFTHVGLTPESECFEECSKGWAYYVGESLRGLITSGRGKPDAKEKGRPR